MAKIQTTFKNKILRLLASRAKTLRCAVCGSSQACYHHILPKGRFSRYIADPENLIELCPRHHSLGNDLAAHSTDSIVVARFVGWLKENHPEQYQWAENARNQGRGSKVDYAVEYYKLKTYFDEMDKECE